MRVLVGLSGGVDSMCAALRLIRSGEYVEGAVLRMHEYTEIDSAQSVADALGIKLNIIDCQDDFDRIIKSNFVEEYSSARTPNPCILCNERIKFARLAEFAREVSYYRDVSGIEELLKDARKCQRKSKPEDLIPQASFSHRFSVS